MPFRLKSWLAPASPEQPELITDVRQRRALVLELVIVFAVTLGLAAASSLLSLIDGLLRTERLADQAVAINRPHGYVELLELLQQLLRVTQLVAWGALGVYLLWRAGVRLSAIGLDRSRPGGDLLRGAGLAALIGIPGLGFYLLAYHLGASRAVLPSTLDDSWWASITLILAAAGNGWAEEILVVGYLLTRLRQLGWSENASLVVSAVLRGAYHLYQGFGGFVGNLVMGLVFGRVWQRTNRLWPLVVAHTLLDVVAFVGYTLLRDRVSWLPG